MNADPRLVEAAMIIREATNALTDLTGDIPRRHNEHVTTWKKRTTLEERLFMAPHVNSAALILDAVELSFKADGMLE